MRSRTLPLFLASALVACSSEPAPPPVAPPGPATAAAPAPSEAPAAPPSAVASATPEAPKEGPPGKLNVILLTIDSLRADMPWAGYPRDIAPVLTAFEKKSVSYTRAYSVSSYTAMSLGGMLAGKYPSELERKGYFFEQFADSAVMFPELLQKAGVKTLAAHAHFYFDQKSGFRQGFDVYSMVPNLKEDNKTDQNITAPEHVALAQKILGDKANTSGTFFAWFHFLDPHDEYMPHPGIGPYGSGKKPRDKYDAEITFVDQHLGKLLEFIKAQPWGKNTAIIVSADHGEGFGEPPHKHYRHGFELWETLVHVPLMIQAPGAAPRRIDTPRSAIDFAPTILELTGAPANADFAGKSLVPELYGKASEERDVISDLPRTSDNDRKRTLVHGKYKLISFGDDFAFELYDVVADPYEEHNLAKTEPKVYEEMKARYKSDVAKIKDRCPARTEHLKGKEKGRRC